MICRQCPRNCGADRDISVGYCGLPGQMKISHVGLHMWEEPCISGKNGSGTVFFAGCSLGCVFCQNFEISHRVNGRDASAHDLTEIFKRLENEGAENINLVNPTHYSSEILNALRLYKPSVPVVWNSGGYEKAETLKTLEGFVDIYLPDIKFFDSDVSARYSSAPDYFEYASSAVTEMFRQTGKAVFDDKNMMLRGTVIRHLVMPSNVGQACKILRWIHQNLPDVYISLLGQYFPAGLSSEYPEINRRLKRREYDRAVNFMISEGFTDGFMQELGSASSKYVPHFDGTY